MSELSKSDVDRLLQAIRKIPPYVVGTPIDRDEFIVEFAEETTFKNFKKSSFEATALELFNLLEDIEKSIALTQNDLVAMESIVKELAGKRFVYLSQEKANELRHNKDYTE